MVVVASQAQATFEYILYHEKLLDSKATCIEMKLKPGDELLGVQAKGGNQNAIMWRRYPTEKIKPESTWHMPTGTSWDVLKFTANRAVRI